LRLSENCALNSLNGLLRSGPGRHVYADLVPHPLPRGRKVEVLTGNRKIVDERHPTSRRMSFVRPVPGFEQHRPEQSNLHHFAAYAIDLDPISDSDSVFAHQYEPSEKCQNE